MQEEDQCKMRIISKILLLIFQCYIADHIFSLSMLIHIPGKTKQKKESCACCCQVERTTRSSKSIVAINFHSDSSSLEDKQNHLIRIYLESSSRVCHCHFKFKQTCSFCFVFHFWIRYILKLLPRVADVATSLYGFWFIVINRVDCVTERRRAK